MNTY